MGMFSLRKRLFVYALLFAIIGGVTFYLTLPERPVQDSAPHVSIFDRTLELAESGDAEAQEKLGHMYRLGKHVEKNDTEAFKWFLKAAEQGRASAQNSLGLRYRDGEGAQQDIAVALKWLKKASEAGNADAASNIARMYAEGLGVEVDISEAVTWHKVALKNGEVTAATHLGRIYRDGDGIPHDYGKAVEFYRLAVEKGEPYAQNGLGYMYQHGLGVDVDMYEAGRLRGLAAASGKLKETKEYIEQIIQYCHKHYNEDSCWFSAGAGDAEAMRIIGLAYSNGKWGMEQDDAKGREWFEKAAKAKSPAAQLQLAAGYFAGKGDAAPRDMEAAYVWFSVAETWPQWNEGQRAALSSSKNMAIASLIPDGVKNAEERAAEYIAQYGYHDKN